MKIVTVVGARPQFVKAAVFSRRIRDDFPSISEIIVHTGQHYDEEMSDIFFEELDLPRPQYNLGVGGGSHGQNTGRMLERLESLLKSERPDWVLVYGDTDSTLAAALAAVKLHIPIAHVEAGLRSYNRKMPEEINRLLVDHISTALFSPTSQALKNLADEGVQGKSVIVVGDIMYDAALYYAGRAKRPVSLDSSDLTDFVLCTMHRAENVDNAKRLQGIMDGLASSGLNIILPLHPRTKTRMKEFEISLPDNVRVIDPVGYLEMIWLERNCRMIVTDSGGVQKEAYFFSKPCVTLRDETEWVELVECGVNVLVGADAGRISAALMSKGAPKFPGDIYGDGNAAGQIAKYLSVCMEERN